MTFDADKMRRALEEEVSPDTKPIKQPKKPRQRRKQAEAPSEQSESRSRCLAYAPRGTVCKFCGKVHPQ